MSKGSSWHTDNSAIVTVHPETEDFPYGNNHRNTGCFEFQMFKEMGIYPLDTGTTHGNFLNRDDTVKELDMIFKVIGLALLSYCKVLKKRR